MDRFIKTLLNIHNGIETKDTKKAIEEFKLDNRYGVNINSILTEYNNLYKNEGNIQKYVQRLLSNTSISDYLRIKPEVLEKRAEMSREFRRCKQPKEVIREYIAYDEIQRLGTNEIDKYINNIIKTEDIVVVKEIEYYLEILHNKENKITVRKDLEYKFIQTLKDLNKSLIVYDMPAKYLHEELEEQFDCIAYKDILSTFNKESKLVNWVKEDTDNLEMIYEQSFNILREYTEIDINYGWK